MANCQTVVKHYRNLNRSQFQDLWTRAYKNGPRIEVLREILLFYFHHKHRPPVKQESVDSLLQSPGSKEIPKKVKQVIFQIIEEVCSCLESSIVEKITLSSLKDVPVDLLSCICVGGLIPLLDADAVEKLCSLVRSSEISAEKRGKALSFLCEVAHINPALVSSDNASRLMSLMTSWFKPLEGPSVSSPSRFGRSDILVATEVDGTAAGEVFSVLTLAKPFSDHHIMNIHLFSMIREWLGRKLFEKNKTFFNCVREYCSLVVEQSLRPATKEHDVNLQKAILCEVLDILVLLVQLDQTQAPHCLLIVKRIQSNVSDKFKADYRDICVLLRVLNFLLNFGESTGYNSQLFCEQFLGDIVYRSYTSSMAAFDIAVFLSENKHKMPGIQKSLLQRFFPNLLKLLASHPSIVIEEFVDLIPQFTSPETAIEVFHTLLDLPVLSATLCLHQAPALLQQEQAGSLDPYWAIIISSVRLPENRSMFNYLMRIESGQQKNLINSLPPYMKLLKDLRNHGLVVTCSQVVPLLLEAFFTTVGQWKDPRAVGRVIPVIFTRLLCLYEIPGYREALHRCFFLNTKEIFKKCPQLVFTIPDEIMEYISILKNHCVSEQLYAHILWAVGQYSYPFESSAPLALYYETVECLIYEMLAHIATEEPASLQIMNVACSTLAKLAIRYQDHIQRAVLCLNKVRLQVSSGLLNTPLEDKQIVYDRIEELLCLLRNPNVASVVWSSSQSHNPSMSAVVQILAHITDS